MDRPSSSRWIFLLVLVLASALLLSNSVEAANDDNNEVETNVQFYMHDNLFAPNPTAIPVAGPNGSANSNTLVFGSVVVIDDALTEGPSPSSKSLGRGQGTYLVSSLDASSFLLTFTAVFSQTNGTLSFHGADRVQVPTREVAVVGGTGVFRFARGYAVVTTASQSGFSVVLHFNVTVRVANSTGIALPGSGSGNGSSSSSSTGSNSAASRAGTPAASFSLSLLLGVSQLYLLKFLF